MTSQPATPASSSPSMESLKPVCSHLATPTYLYESQLFQSCTITNVTQTPHQSRPRTVETSQSSEDVVQAKTKMSTEEVKALKVFVEDRYDRMFGDIKINKWKKEYSQDHQTD